MGKPYKYILLTSALFTALLFCLDFFWLDPDNGGVFSQVLFDIVTWGGMYTLIFFLFFSGIYFISQKVSVKSGAN